MENEIITKKELDIDNFLDRYSEAEMSSLLRKGDIFQKDNKILKVLE